MASIFTARLEALVWDDVLTFLMLDQPEALRPAEGPRIDFKRELKPEVSKMIAAMANSQGGLILVGVDEKEVTGRSIPGTLFLDNALGNKAEDAIANMVSARIDPRPEFESKVLMGSWRGADYRIMVVRVPQGDDTPYMYEDRIPVRFNAITAWAGRRDLDILASRRSSTAVDPIQALDLGGNSAIGYLARDQGDDKPDWIHMVAAPLRPLSLRLDSTSESLFLRGVEAAGFLDFFSTRYSTVAETRDMHVFVGRRSDGGLACCLRADGRIEIAIASRAYIVASHNGPAGATAGYLVADLDAFLRLAVGFYAANQYFGDLATAVTVHSGTVLFRPWFSINQQISFIDAAIPNPGSLTHGTAPTMREDRREDIADPHLRPRWISEVLCNQLRSTQRADVNLVELENAVRQQLRA